MSLFVGVMWNRLGTSTPRSESGTVEEFERAADALAHSGRPQIWFYFSDAPTTLQTKDQLEQRMGVVEFRERFQANGLSWSYANSADFNNKFRNQLLLWLGSYQQEVVVPKPAPPAAPLLFPDAYRDWLIRNYQHLDAERLQGSDVVTPSLPEIFIPLLANPPDQPEGKNRQEGPGQEERKPVDLEALAAEREILLIEGHPGSGKTTLLKHITYCLAKPGQGSGALLAPLDGSLPLLIFFKDLHDYFKTHRTEETVFDLIDWYCGYRMGGTIDGATIRGFVEQGRTVILLDGLDELAQQWRDQVVSRFDDLRIKHPGVRLITTGRPHGIDSEVVKRFGKERVSINSLTMEQVEEFVTKWFCYFYPGDNGPGGRTAASLISEVKSHPAVGALIDNPLMLTAICILYHDQRELPGQRAELYKRFVDNMLYRRFGADFEKVLAFLKTFAHTLHIGGLKVADELVALEVMRRVYRRKEHEEAAEYEREIRKRFGEIEAQCGLLKAGQGGYEFQHLTFQEFLCAGYLFDVATEDLAGAIEPYWEDDWHREMIELYISLISISSKGMANTIVRKALGHPNQGRWLKGAAALNDFQENRRDLDVTALAREALQRIFRDGEHVGRKALAEAGELLGWLGDPRDLKEFVSIAGGEYDLEELGAKSILPFEIGRYPVTNDWYREFVSGGGYASSEWWSEAGWLAPCASRGQLDPLRQALPVGVPLLPLARQPPRQLRVSPCARSTSSRTRTGSAPREGWTAVKRSERRSIPEGERGSR